MIVDEQRRRQGLYQEDTTHGDSLRVACKITVIVVNTFFLVFHWPIGLQKEHTRCMCLPESAGASMMRAPSHNACTSIYSVQWYQKPFVVRYLVLGFL